MYQKTSKGWDRFKLFIKMLSPSRHLHQFPPHFILRDVLVELVEQAIHREEQCRMLLFDVKNFAEIKSLYPTHVLQQIESTIIESFRDLIAREFAAESIIAMQKYYDDDYLVIVKDEGLDNEAWQEKQERFRVLIEQELAERTVSFFDFPLSFYTSSVRIEPKEELFEAIQHALQDARSIAKKHLPANIGHIRAQLRQIIEEERIRVLAQPIISLETGEAIGWEMLTRGPADTPYAMPDELFHYAYQTDMLIHLELLVVKKAFLVITQKKSFSPVFINVTVPTIRNPYFFTMVKKLCDQFPDISPTQIVFEITERHVVDDYQEFNRSVADFRKSGFKLAVDDTGAGYASLNMISELLPDVIKIDRSIIRDIDQHAVKDTVLEALLLVAKKIGCNVVAEGIETEEEAKVLINRKVDYGQGYFFSKPREPFVDLPENWISKQRSQLTVDA